MTSKTLNYSLQHLTLHVTQFFFQVPLHFGIIPETLLGRDTVVDTVTCYWLDGPMIESQWRQRVSASVQTGPGAHPAS